MVIKKTNISKILLNHPLTIYGELIYLINKQSITYILTIFHQKTRDDFRNDRTDDADSVDLITK